MRLYSSTGSPPLDPEFIQAVQKAVDQLSSIDQRKHFPSHWKTFYRRVKNEGIEKALEGFDPPGDRPSFLQRMGLCFSHLGEILFALLRANGDLNRFLPYTDIDVRITGHEIEIHLDQMLTATTTRGVAYYSRFRPTITVDGQEYVVAFSKTALARICERVVLDWRSYWGYGDAFSVYGRCVYFEPCTVPYQGRRQPAFTFYHPCLEGHFTGAIRDRLLDGQVDPDRSYYWRMGYCPVDLNNGFARAITTLYPGMDGTPKHSLLMATKLPHLEKVRLIHSMEAVSSYKALCETEDFSAMKWIHDSYVPQVVELPLEVYRYD